MTVKVVAHESLNRRARARLALTVTPRPTTHVPSQCPSGGMSSAKRLQHLQTFSVPRHATIEELSDKVLLSIFCYFLDASPRYFPTLMHICRKWRRIVSVSQRALQLRLFCTPGTPVLKTLDCWSTLPIVVQYGGSPALDSPAPEDEDNIMAALKRSDRVTSIGLTVTRPLLKKLSTIESPFLELEDLVLLSQDSVSLTLPNNFWCGPRLRRLHSTRIAFPSHLQLLLSSRNLVDLQLHEALNPWHFLPRELTNALSGMVQLRSLSLHFLSTPGYRAPLPPPGELVVLPALTRFNFRGNSQYSEGLVARIDAPRLGDIEVTFVHEIIFELTALSAFINRIEIHKSYRRVDILPSEHEISIALTQPGAPTCLRFRLLCKELSYQLLSMARICTHFSAFLLNVEDLRISTKRPSRCTDRIAQWRESISPFTGVKWLHVSGNLSKNLVCALQQPDKRHGTLLPALHTLHIREPGQSYSPLRRAVVSLMESRRLSGHPLEVKYEHLHVHEPGKVP